MSEIVYDLEGSLLEACSCGVLCPCWVGEDPDGGTCDSALAWTIEWYRRQHSGEKACDLLQDQIDRYENL